MANANQRDKNAVSVVGGLAFTEQELNPLATEGHGLYFDSDGVPHLMMDGAERGVAALSGIIPSARLIFSAQPTDADTIGIGGKTFTFKTTLGAAGSTVQVEIGSTAADTLASLVKAVNGDEDDDWVEATTAFAVAVVADAVESNGALRLRNADERGGTAVAGTASVALAEAITDAADIWNCANLSVSGKEASDYQCSAGVVAITAAMVTAGSFYIELPFTPTAFVHVCSSSAGVQRAITDAITISGDAIKVALAGGGSPAIQAGDLFRFFAIA